MGVWSKCKYSPNRKRKLTNRRDDIVTYFFFSQLVPFIKKIDMCNKEYMLKGDALKWIDKDNILFFLSITLPILIVWFNLDRKQKEINKTKKNTHILLTIKFWLMNQNINIRCQWSQFFSFIFVIMKWKGVCVCAKGQGYNVTFINNYED